MGAITSSDGVTKRDEAREKLRTQEIKMIMLFDEIPTFKETIVVVDVHGVLFMPITKIGKQPELRRGAVKWLTKVINDSCLVVLMGSSSKQNVQLELVLTRLNIPYHNLLAAEPSKVESFTSWVTAIGHDNWPLVVIDDWMDCLLGWPSRAQLYYMSDKPLATMDVLTQGNTNL